MHIMQCRATGQDVAQETEEKTKQRPDLALARLLLSFSPFPVPHPPINFQLDCEIACREYSTDKRYLGKTKSKKDN